jgi:hypothetical protein
MIKNAVVLLSCRCQSRQGQESEQTTHCPFFDVYALQHQKMQEQGA